MIAVATEFWGSSGDPVQSPLPTRTRLLFGEGSGSARTGSGSIAIAVAVTAVLSAIFRWTRIGQATEAVAENPVAASSLGYSPDRIAIVNWAAGGTLAALAGILVAPILFLNVAALAFTVLRALAAALVGSFRSFWLTLAGAMGIGVIESVLSRYIEDRGVLGPLVSDDNLFLGTFTSPAVYRSAAFLVIVVVLAVGGRALPLRSDLLDRLPAVGSGRVHVVGVLVTVVATAVALLTVPDDWALALVISMATAIVCLSLVVVTGLRPASSRSPRWRSPASAHGSPGASPPSSAGTSSRRCSSASWPSCRSACSSPSRRSAPAGINLAVLTFGLAVVISELVLGNSGLTGGFDGTKPHPPTLFGIEIDAFSHPGRYGLVVLVVLTLLSLMVANLRRGRSGASPRSRSAPTSAPPSSLGVSVPAPRSTPSGLAAAIAGVRRDPAGVPVGDHLLRRRSVGSPRSRCSCCR